MCESLINLPFNANFVLQDCVFPICGTCEVHHAIFPKYHTRKHPAVREFLYRRKPRLWLASHVVVFMSRATGRSNPQVCAVGSPLSMGLRLRKYGGPGPIHLELGMVAENLPLRRFLRSPARKAACRGFGGPLGAETVLQGA